MQEQADFNPDTFSAPMDEADKALLVRFFVKPVQNQAKSREAGRPVFIEKEYIDIKIAGNRSDSVSRPATWADKQRFPRHYAAFKQRIEMPEEGTPLSEWSVVTRSQAEELSFYNIKTVEQLASVSDGQGQQFMGFHGLKAQAKAWIEDAKKGVDVSELQEALATRDDQIAQLQDQVNQLLELQTTAAQEPETAARSGEKVETSSGAEEEAAKPVSRRRRTKK